MLAAFGGRTVCGERVVGDPVGGVIRRDGECQRAERGGKSRSPLEPHASWLLELIAKQADLTLAEIVQRLLQDRGVRTTDSSLDRFFKRHKRKLQKKLCTRPSRSGPTWPKRGNAGRPARRTLMRNAWCSSMRPEPRLRWSAPVGGVAAAGG